MPVIGILVFFLGINSAFAGGLDLLLQGRNAFEIPQLSSIPCRAALGDTKATELLASYRLFEIAITHTETGRNFAEVLHRIRTDKDQYALIDPTQKPTPLFYLELEARVKKLEEIMREAGKDQNKALLFLRSVDELFQIIAPGQVWPTVGRETLVFAKAVQQINPTAPILSGGSLEDRFLNSYIRLRTSSGNTEETTRQIQAMSDLAVLIAEFNGDDAPLHKMSQLLERYARGVPSIRNLQFQIQDQMRSLGYN